MEEDCVHFSIVDHFRGKCGFGVFRKLSSQGAKNHYGARVSYSIRKNAYRGHKSEVKQ